MFNLDRWIEMFQTLSKNKLRTVLSGFTIAFAILLFTLLFGIGNGLKHTFERDFAGNAQNSIYINSGRTTKPYKGLQSGRKIQFRNDDTKFLNEKFEEEIQFLAPVLRDLMYRPFIKESKIDIGLELYIPIINHWRKQ